MSHVRSIVCDVANMIPRSNDGILEDREGGEGDDVVGCE
jgi:hypothetical protein